MRQAARRLFSGNRRYSAFAIVRGALGGRRPRAFRNAAPKKSYDTIIVGGGGHGLAAAHYLANRYGVADVAVLERGFIGGGNVGRNTTIVRANYMIDGNTAFYRESMRLWETLSADLNFNVMFSPRGRLDLIHSPPEWDAAARRGNIMKAAGIPAELIDASEVRRRAPMLNFSADARFPIIGALLQSDAGTARHDAVAWGFARAADCGGADIVQNCEVTGFIRDGDKKVVGVKTARGDIRANKIGIAAAGHTSRVAALAGLRLPIESHLLQAFVSESVAPMLDCVLGFGAIYFYISQSDHGGLVFGGDLDGYNSYARRGNLPRVVAAAAAAKSLIPAVSRLRVLRHWGGVVDMSMDGSPIIAPSPLAGLYINGGWCYGGFKATPASGLCFAHLLATGESHPLAAKYTLSRFREGKILDEKGRGPSPWAH